MRSETLTVAMVSNLLASGIADWTIDDERRDVFDFLLVNRARTRRVALEVVRASRLPSQMLRLCVRFKLLKGIDELWLVTADSTPANNLSLPPNVRVIELRHLSAAFGRGDLGDLSDAKVQSRLQTQALVKNYEKYKQAPIGPAVERSIGAAVGVSTCSPYFVLHHQLSFRSIVALEELSGDRDAVLSLGQRVQQATVVFSDLKNFSTLVTASSPEILQQYMERYYSGARRLVFEHGGMLDKFIGDAVLAVFGYPLKAESDVVAAIEFAHDLVLLGERVLRPWLDEINAAVETGTRVGIATGDIWPLDIGAQELQLSLLGDTINLAARLEHECETNGILIDNRTHTRVEAARKSALAGFSVRQRTIEREQVKGQPFPVSAWQIAPFFAALRVGQTE